MFAKNTASNFNDFIKKREFPISTNNDFAKLAFEKWKESAVLSSENHWFTKELLENPFLNNLFSNIFGNSPFLTSIACREGDFLSLILKEEPENIFFNLIKNTKNELDAENDRNKFMSKVRVFKRKASLLIAVMDISGFWTLETITKALSVTAETALNSTLLHLLKASHSNLEIDISNPENSGIIILGMGKLGANELNYSSDIDLIVLFDEKKINYKGNRTVRDFCIRMTREIIRIMEERTVDGYVFRTDLRLRPDPASTPIALPVSAAETYYESFGQNWERAAMIKARPVAGDIDAGNTFLKNIKPFIWRKSLDFKTIQDIKNIKKQIIGIHSTDYDITLEGHNVKLGRGGIREIEFFAQMQQLIWGGRNPKLRINTTCEALDELVIAGYLEPNACSEMKDAYRFLRMIEHRLQMINDQQTHELPKSNEKLTELSFFCGFNSLKEFENKLLHHFRLVEKNYTSLFNETKKEPLPTETSLDFSGNDHNLETLRTLINMGFENPETISLSIKGWLNGKPRATRTTRSRELLNEILPSLLKALSLTSQPYRAFNCFDEFLYGQPAGVQLFYLFQSAPALLNLVAKIMGDAPKLSLELRKNPSLLDNVLEPEFFAPLPPSNKLKEELDNVLSSSDSFESVLDACRRWVRYRRFQIGVQILENIIDGKTAGKELTNLVDLTISAILPFVQKEFVKKYGVIEQSRIAIIALGKVGGCEMTPKSDLDLIIIYDVKNNDTLSNGESKLAPSTYFARFTQRFINAVNAPTAEGKMWDIDMRLRPSGRAGPLATSLESFSRYQIESAWVWEHQALTRARIIYSDNNLCNEIETVIKNVICLKKEPLKLAFEINDMRKKMLANTDIKSMFDVKHRKGGMIDIEFIIQFIKLLYAEKHPTILKQNTLDSILEITKVGILNPTQSEHLSSAYTLWLSIQAMVSLTIDNDLSENVFPIGLKKRLTMIIGKNKTFDDLKKEMNLKANNVSDVYLELIGQSYG